jgi:hypothetical protein
MRVVDPTPENVRYVAERMRETDLAEFLATSFCDTREDLVDALVERYGNGENGFCFTDGDEPVGIAVLLPVRPNVIALLFFATGRFPGIAVAVTRFTLRTLFPSYRDAGVHRIETISIEGYDAAHRWIEILGLKREGRFEGFGRNGEAFHQFAWVADDVR